MLISIVTPTFNSEKTIQRNIDSIINQTYQKFEHIIVDNLSKDNTISIINKAYEKTKLAGSLRIISEKDKGISEAFNKGIKAAKGEIIVILNSDDEYFHDEVFQEVVNVFKNKQLKIAYGNVYFFDPLYGSNVRFPLSYGIPRGIQFIHPAMFMHRSVYDEVGLYNESYAVSMDFDYYCRLVKTYGNLKERCFYISEKPMVTMNAGGVSWKNENKSIAEIKTALKEHDLWDLESARFYYARKFRAIFKEYLTQLNLEYIVKMWRKNKWKN